MKTQKPRQTDFIAARNFMSELGKIAHQPAFLIETRAAELLRDYREVVTMTAGAVFKTVQDQLNDDVRATATALLIHLHASVGHQIPGVFTMPEKSLPELLNDLENALFTTAVPAAGTAAVSDKLKAKSAINGGGS